MRLFLFFFFLLKCLSLYFPDLRDNITQALACFACFPYSLEALENLPLDMWEFFCFFTFFVVIFWILLNSVPRPQLCGTQWGSKPLLMICNFSLLISAFIGVSKQKNANLFIIFNYYNKHIYYRIVSAVLTGCIHACGLPCWQSVQYANYMPCRRLRLACFERKGFIFQQ